MAAPINVKLYDPTDTIDGWQSQAQEWLALNKEVGGNLDFYPLTIKFGYVLGVIHDICESVARLLEEKEFARRTSYIPAYGLFASAVELLGRCVGGQSTVLPSPLGKGLNWLAKPQFPGFEGVAPSATLISTTQRSYGIKDLVNLRHFAAHGQAMPPFQAVDYEIIDHLRPLLRDGLEHYWASLQNDELPCNRLARANVVPLRGWPVLKTWLLLQGQPHAKNASITELFDEFARQFSLG